MIITFIAHEIQNADNGEGHTYLERKVEMLTEYGERIVYFMCDPEAGWNSRDQWLSDKHAELMSEAV